MDSLPPHGVGLPAQPKTSGQAIWSLVLGILSIPCLWLLGSIPAIILGILAIKNIDRAPQQLGGKGLAIAGIITGSIGVFTGVAMMAAISLPAFTQMNENAKLTKQTSEVRQLILGCKAYAADSGGKFPPNLEVLVQESYLDTDALLKTQDLRTGEPVPYLYRAGLEDSGAISPVIIGPAARGGKRVVGFSDGSVRALRDSEFENSIELEMFE